MRGESDSCKLTSSSVDILRVDEAEGIEATLGLVMIRDMEISCALMGTKAAPARGTATAAARRRLVVFMIRLFVRSFGVLL
jgi:hypothetical protein